MERRERLHKKVCVFMYYYGENCIGLRGPIPPEMGGFQVESPICTMGLFPQRTFALFCITSIELRAHQLALFYIRLSLCPAN